MPLNVAASLPHTFSLSPSLMLQPDQNHGADLPSFPLILPILVVFRAGLETHLLQEAFLLPQDESGPLFCSSIAAVHNSSLPTSHWCFLFLLLLAPETKESLKSGIVLMLIFLQCSETLAEIKGSGEWVALCRHWKLNTQYPFSPFPQEIPNFVQEAAVVLTTFFSFLRRG